MTSKNSLARPTTLTGNQAARLMHRLICSYPTANPVDLKGYFAEIALVLGRHPASIAEAGLNAAMRASPNFPPPVPLVEQHCSGLIDGAEFARAWQRGAQLQLEERDAIERESQLEPLEKRRAVTERIMAEFDAKLT